MIRYVAYGRFSTDMQNDKSAEDQIVACDAKAKTFGDWVKVGDYADEGKTGDALKKRSGALALLRDASLNKFDVVIAESLNRLWRRGSDGYTIYEIFEYRDIRIFSLFDNDFITDLHMVLRTFEAIQDLKKVKQGVKRGHESALRRGVLVGRVPYGLRSVQGAGIPRGVWEIDEEEAKIVKRIFAQYASDMSPVEIVARLNAEGTKSPYGKMWRQSALFGKSGTTSGILTNPRYRGEFHWGATENRRDPITGSMVPRRTEPSKVKTIVLPEKLRIIDDAVWNAVQKKIAERRNVGLPKRKLPKHVFSGLLVCGVCGHSYTVSNKSRYACSGRMELRICNNRRRVDRVELEGAVLALLDDSLLNPSLVASYIKTYKDEHRRVFGQANADAAALKKRIAKAERELDNLIALTANDDTSNSARSALLIAIDARKKEVEKLREGVPFLAMPELPEYNPETIVQRLKRQIAHLREYLTADSIESGRARQMVRALIDKIVIFPEGNDDGRGCGPVNIRVEGRIGELLRWGDESQDRGVQLALGSESRLNHVIWSAIATIENVNKRLICGPPMNTELVFYYLRTAIEPISKREIVLKIMSECGLHHTQQQIHAVTIRVQNALNFLKDAGAAVVTILPGGKRHRWALASREREFWPKGVPVRVKNLADTDKVLDVLGKATTLVTAMQIADHVAIAAGERPRRKRMKVIGSRVRACLHFLRTQGVVLQVTFGGAQTQGWLLTERKNELLPEQQTAAEGTVSYGLRVLAVLAKAKEPIISKDIARQIVDLTGDPPTERNMRRAEGRVRDHIRRLHREGLVQWIKMKGKRYRGWSIADTSKATVDVKKLPPRKPLAKRTKLPKRPIPKPAVSAKRKGASGCSANQQKAKHPTPKSAAASPKRKAASGGSAKRQKPKRPTSKSAAITSRTGRSKRP